MLGLFKSNAASQGQGKESLADFLKKPIKGLPQLMDDIISSADELVEKATGMIDGMSSRASMFGFSKVKETLLGACSFASASPAHETAPPAKCGRSASQIVTTDTSPFACNMNDVVVPCTVFQVAQQGAGIQQG